MAAQSTRKRQSRADRAADQAEQSQGQQQPEPETTPDPPDHFGGPSSDTRADEAAEDEQPEDEETEEQPEPEATPELPLATGDLGRGRIVYFQPSLTMPDGTTVECPHSQWGHGKESAALACLRKLAAAKGVRIETPES